MILYDYEILNENVMKSTHQNLSRNKSQEAPQLVPLCTSLFFAGKYLSGHNFNINMKMSALIIDIKCTSAVG